MEENKTEVRPNIYNVGKVILMSLVVFAHSSRMYSPQGAFKPVIESDMLAKISDLIYQFHMPTYMAITGSVFGFCIEKGKYQNYKEFAINKARRLLIPYYFFGIVIVIPVCMFTKVFKGNYFDLVIHNIVLGRDARHLWYVFALFWIFLVAGIPVIKRVFMSSKWMWVPFVITFLVYWFNPFPGLFSLANAAQYSVFFVTGICLNSFLKIEKMSKYKKMFNALCGFIVIGGGYLLVYNSFYSKIFGVLLPAFIGIVFIYAVGWLLVSLFYKRMSKELSAIRVITKELYGIYLFHPMIIYLSIAPQIF